jgi:hypothetical protein
MRVSATLVLATALGWMLIAASCERTPVEPGQEGFDFGGGVFIVNEGQFLSNNASISYFNPETDSLYNQVFYRANGVPLGDVAHSMLIMGQDAWIVVNNSGKIYRVGSRDMAYKGKITGLTSPRYILIEDSGTGSPKAYVSDLYSGYVTVVDPLEGTRLDSIKFSRSGERLSSEQMVLHNGSLYVACWSYGRQILVIDTSTGRITDSIPVGLQPNSMAVDRDDYLWVLSDGGYPFSPVSQEKASLTRVNMKTRVAETMKVWDDIILSPSDLCTGKNGDSLYFLSEGVYRVSRDMEGFDRPLVPARGRQFYSLGIDPSNGTVYVGDAVDYQQDGWVYRYRPDGTSIDSFRVGVNPGYFCFSYPTQR